MRRAPLRSAEALLAPIRASVSAGRLQDAAEIGLRVGAVVNRYKVRKHFVCQISDSDFSYQRARDKIASEAALDGLSVIRTSLDAEQLSGVTACAATRPSRASNAPSAH